MSLSSLVTGTERSFRAGALMAFPQLNGCIIKGSPAHPGVQRSFKAAPVTVFILRKVSTCALVFLLFRASQSQPPIVTRCVNAFGASQGESLAHTSRSFVIFREDHHNVTPVSQRIFIDEQLIVRQTAD